MNRLTGLPLANTFRSRREGCHVLFISQRRGNVIGIYLTIAKKLL